jgi:membrane-bound lytic murein transglycosylase D
MYHQSKLAVAVSAVLAVSVFSGCSTNNTIKQSSSYQKTMGDVEFQKAAYLLLDSGNKQPKKIGRAIYQHTNTSKPQTIYSKKSPAVRFQKTAFHPTRRETPRNEEITSDLERAAELLGITKQPAAKQDTYKPVQNNQDNYRPITRNNYTRVYSSPLQQVAQEHNIIKQPNVTKIRYKADAVYGDMWQRIFRGQKIPSHRDHPSVRRFTKVYASDRARLNRITNRAANYLFMVVTELERRKMPTELALLPFVESAYVNTARSHAAAAGMWQFIPSTGRAYGLKQRRGYDGRMDSFESTRAALDYLQKLNKQFHGDWFLSLAAYNAGEGRVERAIKYNRRKGRPTNYWNLRLPKETREYVPRLLAYKEIIRNPKRYGISLPSAPSRPALTTVWVNKAVNLRQVAQRAGLPPKTLTALNPSYLHGITTPRLSKRIILPVHLASRLHHIIKRIPNAVDSNYRYAKYTKKKYAKHYKKRYKKSKKQSKRIVTHRIRRGETLYKIALRHGTTVKKIMRMNKLRSSRVQAGKRIKIASQRNNKQYS